MDFINNVFKLKENSTNVKTEILAGFTTFFTMSYLLIISPKLLSIMGLNLTSSITVTAVCVFLGSVLMAFIANKPYAVAPFLGETAFIAYTLTGAMGFSYRTIFACIFISGILLFLLTITNLRVKILNLIPETIKISFCAGLGLFFIALALKDIGIISFTSASIPIIAGNFTNKNVILGVLCFFIIIVLSKRKIKASVLISILFMTLIGVILGDVKLPASVISFPSSISSSLFQLDFSSLLSKNIISIFFVLFFLVNIDTSGAIVGLEFNSDKKHDYKRTMLADSIMVIISPLIGTTTPGAYLDSMTGISSGGRTGLTSLIVAVLFLISMFFTPLISVVPVYAYAPALMYVGMLMTGALKQLDFSDITEFSSAVLTICIMVFTYNIGIGIMASFVIYPLLKLFSGQKNKTNFVLWLLFVLSLIFFIIYPY